MDDLISRQAVVEAIDHHTFDTVDGLCLDEDITVILEEIPTAQPERKRGKWEMLQMPISPPVYKCSVCGSHALQSMTGCLMNRHYEANLTNYCPNCGADMREVDDESN